MRIINKDELDLQENFILNKIASGELFLHPTDTIYGLGCNATDSEAVKSLRALKKRPDKPLSVIAPSKEWIKENCVLPEEHEKWLDKLPGPYTLLLELQNKNAVSGEVTKSLNTIGVRIPEHWISETVSKLRQPVITTSANVVGENFMTSLDNLSSEIKQGLHFVIYEGEKNGSPSKIVDLTKNAKIIER